MEKTTIFLHLCGYKVPFTIIKSGVRPINTQVGEVLEERLLVKSETNVSLDPKNEYIFGIEVEKSYKIIDIFEHNGNLYYVLGRICGRIVDVEFNKKEGK